MPRIDLPDDQWADVRESLDQAPRKLVKRITAVQVQMAGLPSFAAVRQAAKDSDQVERAATTLSESVSSEDLPVMLPLMDALREAQILALVKAWSYGDVTAEVLDEIPEGAFQILAAEADKRSADAAEKTRAQLLDPTPLPVASND